MNQGTPHYPLDRVKRLVRDGHCKGVRKAVRDAENLGYEDESKFKLLEELSERDFHHVWSPPKKPDLKMDVYIITRRSLINPEYICDIYIKFMICEEPGAQSIMISELELRSFHLVS
jgi:hypothetical protein